MSAAMARPTPAGNLPIGISLPGDRRHLHRAAVDTARAGYRCLDRLHGLDRRRLRRGSDDLFLLRRAFLLRGLGRGCAFFWMTSTAGSSDGGGRGRGRRSCGAGILGYGLRRRETNNTQYGRKHGRGTHQPYSPSSTRGDKHSPSSFRLELLATAARSRAPIPAVDRCQNFPLTGLFFEVGRNLTELRNSSTTLRSRFDHARYTITPAHCVSRASNSGIIPDG